MCAAFPTSSSLLPWDESTPKHSSRGRGRSSSHQKTSAAALFEDSQEDDLGSEDQGETSTGKQQAVAAAKATSDKLEHPTFPWQQAKQGGTTSQSKEHKESSDDAHPSGQTSLLSREPERLSLSDTTSLRKTAEDLSSSQSLAQTQLVSFQEQLFQQQKQVQEQLMQLQSLGGQFQAQEGETKVEEERMREEVKVAQERVKELESMLEKEKAEHSEKQVLSIN